MSSRPILLSEALQRYPEYNAEVKSGIGKALEQALKQLNRKIVVLDDDPTGTQTVHGVPVYTDWSEESLSDGFRQNSAMFYVLTNSRSFSPAQTEQVHNNIAQRLLSVSARTGMDFLIISRSDSTLRGHYPLETATLRDALEACSGRAVDCEIICPFFIEGGRYTFGDTHYVKEGDFLIPAGETEFAQDKTFGYKHSSLPEWIEEKSDGAYRAQDVKRISLEELRGCRLDELEHMLRQTARFDKVILNALSYWDLKVFCIALIRAILAGKRFLIRSAAGLPKILGGIPDMPLLGKSGLIESGNSNGGLVVIGSHVHKTTCQFERLRELENLELIEFNQHTVFEPEKLSKEVENAVKRSSQAISGGKTAVLYTRRERVDAPGGGREKNLRIATIISDAVSSIVQNLEVRPAFIIAKGGITSSDIATKGLGIREAMVAGQILPGVPVWTTGDDSKFPRLPYIIFPGNVGEDDALKQIVSTLQNK